MKKLECCEGGAVGAGCYHDHCTGPTKSKDPFVQTCGARVGALGKVKLCAVEATAEGFAQLKASPDFVFQGDGLLFAGRPEDYYASPHYEGRIAARVTRDAFRRGVHV